MRGSPTVKLHAYDRRRGKKREERAPAFSRTVIVAPLGQGTEGWKEAVLPIHDQSPAVRGSIEGRASTEAGSIERLNVIKRGDVAEMCSLPPSGEKAVTRGAATSAAARSPTMTPAPPRRSAGRIRLRAIMLTDYTVRSRSPRSPGSVRRILVRIDR